MPLVLEGLPVLPEAGEPAAMSAERVALKLRGPRQLEAADWMLGHSVPEEIDGEGLAEWGTLGADVRDGVLTVPSHLLVDFIEECMAGAEQLLSMSDGWALSDDERKNGRAAARALTTIAEKLRP